MSKTVGHFLDCGRVQPSVGNTVLGQLVLGCVRNQTEKTRRSKLVSSMASMPPPPPPCFRSCLKVPVLMTFRDRPWYGSVSKPKQPFLPQVAFGSGAVYHSDRNLTKTIVNPWGSGSTVAENPLFIFLPPLFVLLLKGVARLYSKDLQGPGSFPRLLLCSLGSA